MPTVPGTALGVPARAPGAQLGQIRREPLTLLIEATAIAAECPSLGLSIARKLAALPAV